MILKAIVYLNLIVGVALLSWSVGLYTQKLHWIDRAGPTGEKIEGEITTLKAEIEGLMTESRIASHAWGSAYTLLTDTEKTRLERKRVLDTRLEWARKGDPKRVGFYTDELIPGTALIDTEKLGPAIKGPDGQPLRGADTLSQTIIANDQEMLNAIKEIEKLKLEQEQLQKREKLLQLKVDRDTVILDNLKNEQAYLAAFEVNWLEQLGTVQRRRLQLMKRLTEFQQ